MAVTEGTWEARAVASIKIGDVLVGGGKVKTTMQSLGDQEDLYEIDGGELG